MELWKPRGNHPQTQLDVHIERIRFHIRALGDNLSTLYDGLAMVEQELIEVTGQIRFLKKHAKIVSLREYDKITRHRNGLSGDKAAYLAQIFETKKGIQEADGQMEKLYVKRATL